MSEEKKEISDIDKKVMRYVRNYLEQEIVQDPGAAIGDPQLGSIVGHLSEALSLANQGRLYDIGCGNGSLLAGLAKLPAFESCPGWRYCPVDFEKHLDEVHRLARSLKLTARTDELTLEQFAEELESADLKIFFCRNVLHELKITQTARLFHSVMRLMGPRDTLIIQDLLRFPEGERHNHCWTTDILVQVLKDIGFSEIVFYELGTRSGNAWMNVKARFLGVQPPSTEVIYEALLSGRQQQWTLWSALEAIDNTLVERDKLIEALDIDLQLASLTRELRETGALELKLDPVVERRLRLTQINKRIEALADEGVTPDKRPTAHTHFRERGAQMTEVETFLRSPGRLAIVHGGAGTGKSTFLDQLLANRLYEKLLVRIDARLARGVWPMIEQMIAQLGVNLSGDILSVLNDLTYSQVSSSIGRLLNSIAPRLVCVVENLDEVLDSNQRFIDPQISTFLTQILGKDGIKVIVSSRREYLPAALHQSAGNYPLVSVRMGRYASEQTVTNVLDDYFDRAKAGLNEYPAALIDAIDRHPLIAALAGRILQREGQGIALDETFIKQVRQKLQDDLIARLVDGSAEAAMEIAAELRIPVPSQVLEALAGRESVYHARANEVIYAVRDRRWSELLAPLGLFRRRVGNDLMPASVQEIEEHGGISHAAIADQLERVYNDDDNPKWLRESFYHRMLSGQIEGLSLPQFVGSYYFTELVASASYCFEHQDYETALTLYNAAATLSRLDESPLMRRASSMIRTGMVEGGNEEYRLLVAEYPRNMGMRRSHIDALLYKNEFRKAKGLLDEYRLFPEEDQWNALLWGRVELGLHNYERAIELFLDLKEKRQDDPFVVVYLARALQQFGDVISAIKVLQIGASKFKDNPAILTSLANNLERAHRYDEAREILVGLLAEDDGNARAAISLVRILLRDGNQHEAQKVAKRAERKATGGIKTFAIMALAEVMLAEGQPETAAKYLHNHLEEDEGIGTLLIDALLRAAEDTQDLVARAELIRKAGEVTIPATMAHNVPVQIVLVKLAVATRDRVAFDSAIMNLTRTRINPAELERLRALW